MVSISDDAFVSAKIKIEDKVLKCITEANIFFNKRFTLPIVKMNQRGKAAGTAYLQRNEVRFNYYMYQQNPKVFIENVVPHEIAHLIVFNLYGGKVRPHGVEWKGVMLELYGIQPDRTHTFNPEPPRKTYLYQCGCQQHRLSIRRHNNILKGGEYVCKLCRSVLVCSG